METTRDLYACAEALSTDLRRASYRAGNRTMATALYMASGNVASIAAFLHEQVVEEDRAELAREKARLAWASRHDHDQLAPTNARFHMEREQPEGHGITRYRNREYMPLEPDYARQWADDQGITVEGLSDHDVSWFIWHEQAHRPDGAWTVLNGDDES